MCNFKTILAQIPDLQGADGDVLDEPIQRPFVLFLKPKAFTLNKPVCYFERSL